MRDSTSNIFFFPVLMPVWPHLFPFRTQSLSRPGRWYWLCRESRSVPGFIFRGSEAREKTQRFRASFNSLQNEFPGDVSQALKPFAGVSPAARRDGPAERKAPIRTVVSGGDGC